MIEGPDSSPATLNQRHIDPKARYMEEASAKSTRHPRRRVITIGVLLLATVVGATQCLGIIGTTWKEEVLLHDGSKIVVKRSQRYGGRHEIGQSPPIKEQKIVFTMPASGERVTWTSEYGEDIGRSNFLLLALHIVNGTAYIVAEPHLCLSYNKWSRPNPPYVVFKHEANEWKRITLKELPSEAKDINVVISTKTHRKRLADESIVSTDMAKKLNAELQRSKYRSILREPLEESALCPDWNSPPYNSPKAPTSSE